MENKSLTKKQFWMKMVSPCLTLIAGAGIIYSGFSPEKVMSLKVFNWVFGGVVIVLSAICIILLIIQRKRYPIVDAGLDREAAESVGSLLPGIVIVLSALLLIGLILLFIEL